MGIASQDQGEASTSSRTDAVSGRGRRFPARWWLAQASLLAIAAVHFQGVIRCLGRCFVDLTQLQAGAGVPIHVADQRLNSWILGWVQRSLLGHSDSFFDANIFYPATGTLTGSEHMLGMAIPLLPLRLWTTDAVALHQAGLILSGLILAWSSFALVRWATGSIWAGWLAGVVALLAPWRISEMAHLQLLSAHWVPLIWLLIARIVRKDAGPLAAVALALVLGFQLLSSYYIAYFTTFSIAVLLGVLFLREGFEFRSALRLLAAAIVPYGALMAFSVPYLQRGGDLELLPRVPLPDFATPAQAWQSLAPGFAVTWGQLQPDAGYALAGVAFLLALAAGLLWALPRDSWEGCLGPARSLAMGLLCVVLMAFVMSLGQRMWVDGEMWLLPAGWASAWIPGFENMRGPLRWQILVGVAIAPLAGLGMWALEAWLGSRGRAGARMSIGIVRALVVLLIVMSFPWRPLPVVAAAEALDQRSWAYRALADLDPGPVLEIPFPMDFGGDVVEGSRYTLASTLHWKPILNGFTAYRPPSYPLLQRVAQALPAPEAVTRLQRLTGLRWIVVHLDKLSRTDRLAWQSPGPGLDRVYSDPLTWIFEVRKDARAGPTWTEALRSRSPRGRTLSGLSRAALPAEERVGEFQARIPASMRSFRTSKAWAPVPFVIENRGSQAWPGLDIQREGLVEMHYRFLRGGVPVFEGFASLDQDIAPGRRVEGRAFVQARVAPGPYVLETSISQRLGVDRQPLSLGTQAREVRVTE